MKTPTEHQYFLREFVDNLEKNILTLSQEHVDALMTQIHTDAEEGNIFIVSHEYVDGVMKEVHTKAEGVAFEIDMLEDLLIHVKTRENYYYNKQNEHYNHAALKPAILCVIILLLLVGLLYCFGKYYYLPKKSELLALIEEIKAYGITITQCSKRVYKSTEYWLEVSATKEYFPIEQYDAIKSMIDQIYKTHSTLHGQKFKWVIMAIVGGAFYVIGMTYGYIRDWWKPQYKERYEKYSWLQTQIEQRIASIQENSL